MSEPLPTLEALRERIAALPARLQVAGEEPDGATGADAPLAVIARQGRLILRLAAAVEGTEAKLRAREEKEKGVDTKTASEWQAEIAKAEEEAGRILREAVVPLMDALDFAAQVAATREDAGLVGIMASARRDGLRRLSGVGVGEIPASVGTPFDGRLHEAVESRPAPDGSPVDPHHILSVVRPGYQTGTEIIRRTTVITAE